MRSFTITIRGDEVPLHLIGPGSGGIPVAIRRHVFARDDYRCQHCGVGVEEHFRENIRPGASMRYYRRFHLDHLLPKTYGGPNAAWNLVLSCHRCNTSRQHWRLPIDLLVRTIRLELELNGATA